MAISVSCGSCGKKFTVKDEYAGKRGKCPACNSPIQVPLSDADGPGAPPIPPPPPARRERDPLMMTVAQGMPNLGEEEKYRKLPPPVEPVKKEPPRPAPRREPPVSEMPRHESVRNEAANPLDDAFELDDRPPPPRGNWRSAASGPLWVGIGGIVVAAVLALLILLPLLTDRDDDIGTVMVVFNLITAGVLATFVGFVFGVIGKSSARSVPDQAARSSGSVAMIFSVIATGLWLVMVVLAIMLRAGITSRGTRESSETMLLLMAFISPLSILSAFLGEIFYCRMAARIGRIYRSGIGTFATTMFIVFLVQASLFVLLLILATAGAFEDEMFDFFFGHDTTGAGIWLLADGGAIPIIQRILWLMSTVTFVVLLFGTRRLLLRGGPPAHRARHERFLDEEDDQDDRPRRQSRDRRERDD